MAEDSRFAFVNPTFSDGSTDAYPGSLAMSRTSWEWLYERYLRRKTVLEALTVRHPGAYLAERRRQYRLDGLASPGTVGDREPLRPSAPSALLPDGGDDGGDPTYSSYSDMSMTPAGVLGAVANLALDPPGPGGTAWGVPGGLSLCVRAGSTTSSAEETVAASAHGGHTDYEWTVSAQVNGSLDLGEPLDLGIHPFFRVLSDYRTDDPPQRVSVPVWDSARDGFAPRSVWTHPAPLASTADTDASTGEFRTVSVSVPGSGRWQTESADVLVFRGGISRITADTAFPCRSAALEPWSGSASYDETSSSFRTLASYTFARDTRTGGPSNGVTVPMPPSDGFGMAQLGDVGLRMGVPEAERGGVGLVGMASGVSALGDVCYVAATPDWGDGGPTWWSAAGGFPHVQPAPPGAEAARQAAVLFEAQPAVPPFARIGVFGFPSGDETRSEAESRLCRLRPPVAVTPVALACGPAEASRHLDALETTVFPVDQVFGFVDAHTDVSLSGSYSGGSGGSGEASDSVAVTVTGAYCGDFSGLVSLVSRAGTYSASGSMAWHDSGSGGTVVAGSASVRAHVTVSSECVVRGLAPLRRSPSGAGGLLRRTVTEVDGSSTDVSTGTESLDPLDDDDDRILAPDVLPWVASADLYAFYDAFTTVREASQSGSSESTSSTEYDEESDTSETTSSETVSADATVTSGQSRRIGLAHLGTLDGNGELELDVAGFVRGADPAPSAPSGDFWGLGGPFLSRAPVMLRVTSSDTGENAGSSSSYRGSYAVNEPPVASGPHFNRLQLYLVVRWNFDTEDPPEATGAPGLTGRHSALAERLRKASASVSDAEAEAAEAAGSASAALAELTRLGNVLTATSAELDRMVADAEAELADAEAELADAEAELADARAALADAEAAYVRGDVGGAAAFASAMSRMRAAEEARAYAEAARDAAEATVGEMTQAATGTVADAEAAIADAEGAAESLQEDCDGLQEDCDGLREDLTEAGTALRFARDADALQDAEAGIAALESSVRALDAPRESLADAVLDLGESLSDARAAVWACRGRGTAA